MLRLCALAGLLACSSAQIHRLPDCADCGRGELRHGLRARDGEASIAALPDGGVVSLERRAAVFYDRAMRERRRIELAPHDAALVATAGDDTYVLARSGRALDLVAIDGRGVRWREAIGVDPGDGLGDNGLDAGPDGPFVYGALALTLPGALASIDPDTHRRGEQVVAFARDGSVRWRQVFDGAGPTLVADHAGGAYVITDEHAAAGSAVAVRRLDRDGHARWTQTIAGTALPGHRLVEAASSGQIIEPATLSGPLVETAARARLHGVAFAGAFAGPRLIVGERSVHASPGAGSTSYLAVLDEQTGAPVLEQVIGDERHGIRLPAHMTVMPSGELAVTGMSTVGSSAESSSGTSDTSDTIVALVGPAGTTAATMIGGTGDQIARSIVASDDGSVWLALTSFEDDLYPDGATLVIGSRRFAEQGLYVLNLLP